MTVSRAIKNLLAAAAVMAGGDALAQQQLTRDALSKADYVIGRRAFQMRCSACHSLAEGGTDLTGPNLWGIVGSKPDGSRRAEFNYSDAMKNAEIGRAHV